ncbi:unnamed protein product [Rotaria sordida]|uniref:Uncharacterized protein n=1 Tax=Rotaria sordida TaxID=392033 RepID=A0A816B9E2_9BILA|nr:unnamed protein product [Rotaria sordida]CAF1607533.1 unnamed protein product [Rotaria sordida]
MYVYQLLNGLFLFTLIFNVYKIQSKEVPFDTIVCFSDSNSDIGNVYKLSNSTWPIDPPYYKRRYSNGKIWIDKLGISNIIDYAYGGATTDNHLVRGSTIYNLTVPDVRQQIAMYKNAIHLRKIHYHRTLYTIWIVNGINDLIRIGAKHILIINLPLFEAYPATAIFNATALLKKLTLDHNNFLLNSVQLLRENHSKISFEIFDLYSLISNILINMTAYGINSTNKCWDTPHYTVVPLCSTPNTYLFIDQFHFTTRVHQFIADAMRKLLIKWKAPFKSHRSIFSV